jgi:hypothetical protein
MKLGTNDIGSVYLGTNAVQKVYLGTNEVWSSYAYLLDDYSGAAAAYSLRLLRSAYTGNAIRVRRASDNTEQNIGFVNNELDTASLTSFCSGTNGFVTTWYDQSGNGRDATQSTGANQPQIVNSGSVILENGKPSVDWATSSYMVNASFNPSSSSGFSAFNVYSSDLAASANTNTMFLYSFGQSVNNNSFAKASSTGLLTGEYVAFFRNRGAISGNFGRLGSTTYRRIADAQVLESDFYLSSGFSYFQNTNAQTMDLTFDGATTTANWSPSQFTLTGGLYLNAFVDTSSSVNCKIQEIIFYDNSQSSNRTGIETNINSFYSIY